MIISEEFLARCGFSLSGKDINVDEDLPNFFEAIKFSQADELIQEFYNMRENYGFEIYNPPLIHKLEKIHYP